MSQQALDATHWVTVYDVTNGPPLTAYAPVLVGLALAGFGATLASRKWAAGPEAALGVVLLLLGVAATFVFTLVAAAPWLSYGQRLRSGATEQIEGTVSNFEPMPYGCHGQESFDVGREHFKYADCRITGAFNKSCTTGGPICGGEHVRMNYVTRVNEDVILKIQVSDRRGGSG